ncbi:hypothetical protein [Dietzia aerolata]|uniref:Uncharacterized protein n=2 Tax=Dietzia aerolata TaxID=595984 RepID=A0ABV5JMF1_9ACTN|nr:hypothetical protein [Dietzia aerolata]
MISDIAARSAHRRSVTSILGITGLAVAASLAAPATAGAQTMPETGSVSGSAETMPKLTPADDRLVATGGSPTGTCFGAVSATIDGEGSPHASQVGWAAGVVGVGNCDLTATLTWKNLDTGETGEKVMEVPSPAFLPMGNLAHPKDTIIPTGEGQVEYTLTTNGGASAGPITVETPEYTEDQ